MKIFVALFAALIMFGAMGAGSVLATHPDASDGGIDAAIVGGAFAPVGSALGFSPGGPNLHPALQAPGFDDGTGTAAQAIQDHNPLCPPHFTGATP